MRDLLAELMDSARARAGYADARFVRSRVERLSTRNGPAGPARLARERGDRDPGARARRVGLRSGARHGPRRRRGGAGPRARRRARRSRPCRTRRRSRPSRRPRGEWSSRFERDPFEVPLEEKLARARGGRRRAPHRAGRQPHPRPLLRVPDRDRVRQHRGRAVRAARDRVRRRDLGGGRRPRREPGPLVPGLARRPRGAGGLRALPRARAARARPRGWPPRRWRS